MQDLYSKDIQWIKEIGKCLEQPDTIHMYERIPCANCTAHWPWIKKYALGWGIASIAFSTSVTIRIIILSIHMCRDRRRRRTYIQVSE